MEITLERLKELSGIQLNEEDKLTTKLASMPLPDAKKQAWSIVKKNGDLTQDQKLQFAGKIIGSDDHSAVLKALKVIQNIQSGNYKANVDAVR